MEVSVPNVHFEGGERAFVAEWIYFVLARFQQTSENFFGCGAYYERLAESLSVVPRKLHFQWKFISQVFAEALKLSTFWDQAVAV